MDRQLVEPPKKRFWKLREKGGKQGRNYIIERVTNDGKEFTETIEI